MKTIKRTKDLDNTKDFVLFDIILDLIIFEILKGKENAAN